MTLAIGKFKINISFRLVNENLEKDILCDDNVGDWRLGSTGDWITASGERAVTQDIIESFELKPFEDILDIQEGCEVKDFQNATFTDETAIELKQTISEWLSKDDRIDMTTVEVQIERA